MNKTLSSIIMAGALTLGYTQSQAQVWNQAHYDEYARRINYSYIYTPKDTLEGVVLEKHKARNNIIDWLFDAMYTNPQKVTILAKNKEGEYFLIKEKHNAYRFKDLKEGSLVELQRAHVTEKEYFLGEYKRDNFDSKKKKFRIERYDKNEFIKGRYLGVRNKFVSKKWDSEKYDNIINQQVLEEYPGIRRLISRIEKKKK
jgi:hypothetical protein